MVQGRQRPLSAQDPIPRVLATLAKAFTKSQSLDIEGYTHLINFFLVGLVIAGSINTVLTILARVSEFLLSPVASNLFLSFLSVTYFISTAVMVWGNLSERYVSGIGKALGQSLSRGMFEDWFDVVYLSVVAAMSVGLILMRRWSEDEFEGKQV